MTESGASDPDLAMSEGTCSVDIRLLDQTQWRASYDLFMGALHGAPSSDDRWEQVRGLYSGAHVLGAYESESSEDLLGTTTTVPLELTLPGQCLVSAAGLTYVGVRSGATRRGIMRRLMLQHLHDLAEAGELLMMFRPSVADLYHRWGAGPAARSASFCVDRLRSGPRPELVGRIGSARELSTNTDLMSVLPAIQRRAASGRTGTIGRSEAWWPCWDPHRGVPGQVHVAVAGPDDAPDGYVTWFVEYEGRDVAQTRRTLYVLDLCAGSLATATDLWLHVLNLELVEEIRATGRPRDEDLPLLLADQRSCTAGPVLDELWLRIIDVPAALAIRAWAPTMAEAVVLEVIDEHLPNNTGRYRIASDGTALVDLEPELRCTVGQLSTLYLGDRSPTQMAGVGLIDVLEPAALPRADRLFAVDSAPWGGSMF